MSTRWLGRLNEKKGNMSMSTIKHPTAHASQALVPGMGTYKQGPHSLHGVLTVVYIPIPHGLILKNQLVHIELPN